MSSVTDAVEGSAGVEVCPLVVQVVQRGAVMRVRKQF